MGEGSKGGPAYVARERERDRANMTELGTRFCN